MIAKQSLSFYAWATSRHLTPFIQGFLKLPPGTILTFDSRELHGLPDPVPYWSAKEAAEAALNSPWTGSETEAVDHLDHLLKEIVAQEMVADVPLGAFLSGGVDSSTIVGLMQAQSTRPVKTFTIGFHEDEFNEAVHARRIAHHLGTDHTESVCNSGGSEGRDSENSVALR